ncbi:MAG: protoporphyrinogen oxidase [Chlorobi bacterium]|nr:protoporphyrinogen oxidase [Chlorobiota bacterium]
MQKKVAIIGAGITGLVTAFYLKKNGVDVKVFEKQNRVGGVINSFSENGFIFETGPNSGVLSNIETVNLFNDLSDYCEIEEADETSKKRLIWKNNKWNALPSGLFTAISTPLFTFSDKIRVLGEPFRKKGTNPHENLSDMVKRRLGKSFLDYAIDPFISGIYAGNTDYLIPKYALPKLYNLEQEYGSFIKGAIKKQKEPKTEDDKKITKEVFSVKGGLVELINALAKNIGEENIKTNCNNLEVKFEDNLFIVDNEKYTNVVSTVNTQAIKEVFSFLGEEELKNILNLKYAKVVEAAIGFNNWEGNDIKAFGGLVPGKEKKNILGVLFMSSIFENRAPKNGALLTVFAGGTKREDLFNLPEDELKELIKKDLQEMMGLKTFKPDLFKLFYYEKAIAQYGVDTKERISAVNNIQDKYKGLFLAGSIVNGVGIADRIKQATDIAKQICS